tara:strand:+ start:339 stop:446 length:108 start_codon:yes stop_codon:yes gene_type:complete
MFFIKVRGKNPLVKIMEKDPPDVSLIGLVERMDWR